MAEDGCARDRAVDGEAVEGGVVDEASAKKGTTRECDIGNICLHEYSCSLRSDDVKISMNLRRPAAVKEDAMLAGVMRRSRCSRVRQSNRERLHGRPRNN
jgi:hypothetical protein